MAVGTDLLAELALVDQPGEGPFRPFTPLALTALADEEMRPPLNLPMDYRGGRTHTH